MLRKAKRTWRSGRPIDTALWFALAAKGYDVAEFEARYLSL